MPELPDVVVYIEALEEQIAGRTLENIRVRQPNLLRSVAPPVGDASGRRVAALRRLGKRICISLDGDIWLVIHLMIAGRLRWRDSPPKLRSRNESASFDFKHGSLLLTEAGTRKRASLFLVHGERGLAEHDPGGLETLDASREEFVASVTDGNHTLKRALTDPRRLSGIGNAYSDEILHRAQLSPVKLTSRLSDDELDRLYHATRDTLIYWLNKLREERGTNFPEKVTAFREGMAVHGRFGEPCPVCTTPVQRIRYVSNETNYCPVCQTGGKLLADRVLSRLLGKDWPRTIEDLEERRRG